MRYEVKIGYPDSDGITRVVEAPDELTAAFRAALNRDTELEVLAIRSEG